MRIAFLTVATGKYIQFVEALKQSTFHYVEPGCDVVVFANRWEEAKASVGDDYRVNWPHLPWPLSTMMRYHAYLTIAETLRQHYDYCFAIDADMVWRAPVNVEELCQPLVACAHPGFETAERASFPYENNPQSACCVKAGEGATYFAGGFIGGSTGYFLGLCDKVTRLIDADLKNHYIPRWHDESCLNRVLIDTPPTKILRGFMVPEEQIGPHTKAPLVALQKKHEEARK